MKKYLMFIKHAESAAPIDVPQALNDAMGEFIARGFESGQLKDTAGLRPTREGFAVRSKNGKLLFTDGPFTEAREIVGGYAMVETETPEQARQIARDFMELHRVHMPDFECECEVRPLDG